MHVAAIDTTGAGDGFVGAFLFARLKGASFELAARIGNVVGALVASRPGAAESMPSREEVRSALTERSLHEELGVVWLEEKPLKGTGRRA
jgi:ribokinase